jgi:hypothetical protein
MINTQETSIETSTQAYSEIEGVNLNAESNTNVAVDVKPVEDAIKIAAEEAEKQAKLLAESKAADEAKKAAEAAKAESERQGREAAAAAQKAADEAKNAANKTENSIKKLFRF